MAEIVRPACLCLGLLSYLTSAPRPYYKLSPKEAPQGGGPYYLSAGKQPEDDGQYRAYVSKTELDEAPRSAET